MQQMNVRLPEESLTALRADAARRNLSLSDCVRELLSGGPAELIAHASNGRYQARTIRYALDTADGLLGGDNWESTKTADWIGDADTLVGWLRANPYHPEGAARVYLWYQAMPTAVREGMRLAVA